MLADRLREARRRRFVGRAAELELFETALEGLDAAVRGPVHPRAGRVGKTACCALRPPAERVGVPVTHVDMRSIAPSPRAFTAAAGRARAAVLLLDTYETAGAIDGWLREQFLPDLASDALVVIAGRDPPAPAWRATPAGATCCARSRCATSIPPTRAPTCASRACPKACTSRAGRHARPPARAALLVDVLAQRPGPVELGAAPDVVRCC